VSTSPDGRSAGASRTPHRRGDGRRTVDYIVVAYRSEPYIGSCLDAIEADRPDNASVIVVDNASPDGSAQVAERHPSRPRVIASQRNLGFGGACNLAVEASQADLLFFMNPDARLTRGTTAGLIDAIESESSVGAAGPWIGDSAGDLRAASAGFEPTLRSVLGHFLLLSRLPVVGRLFPPLQLPAGSPAQAVDWVGGAALLVRAKAYRTVGGFDPSIFLYMEDVDLCRRLREGGWTIRYEPRVSVVHELGGSQGPEQASRWIAAFHDYLARGHGDAYARMASAVAACGLGLRSVVLAPTRRAHAQRLARAAAAAAGLAFGRRPTGPRAVDA
jgi:N-acetylglucosaminyl-diphospho-decaprenol L-rhamnosyltransferase